MCLWKWQSVSWSRNVDCLSALFSSTNKAFFDFFQTSRMCGVAVSHSSSVRELDPFGVVVGVRYSWGRCEVVASCGNSVAFVVGCIPVLQWVETTR